MQPTIPATLAELLQCKEEITKLLEEIGDSCPAPSNEILTLRAAVDKIDEVIQLLLTADITANQSSPPGIINSAARKAS